MLQNNTHSQDPMCAGRGGTQCAQEGAGPNARRKGREASSDVFRTSSRARGMVQQEKSLDCKTGDPLNPRITQRREGNDS